jgi:hypothetical protein
MHGSNIASNSEKLSCKCDILERIQNARGVHMTEEADPKSRRLIRNYARISAIVILTLLLYTSHIVVGRYRENRQADAKSSAAQRAKERENAAQTYESLGGSEFAILNFCALPAEIYRGDSATLCYGVSNAKSVRLDPPAEEVWPSASRCFDVSPKKTTTYQLTAEDAAERSTTASVMITVR